MTDESYSTIEDLARHYRVSISTIRAWMRTGVIPPQSYLKAGRTFRFLLSEVDAAIRANQGAKQTKALAAINLAANTDQDI